MKNPLPRLVAFLMAMTCLGCLMDPKLKPSYSGFEPQVSYDGWTRSTPEAEGFDPARLEEVYQRLFSEDLYPTVRSLLIARHGNLVAEGYSRDPRDGDRLHAVQSVTKSITSLLVGIASGEGLLPSVDTTLYTLMPEFFDDGLGKRSITLRDVLTMRTGLEFDNEGDTAPFLHSSGSSVRNVLRRRLVSEPGTRFYYHDGNPQLASGVLERVTGVTPEAYAEKHLFGPLGIREYRWEMHEDGLNFGAFGLWLRPRDMAKIGQLMLQGGAWEGRQLVPADWIQESTRVHANGNYGFYWWVNDEESRVYRASGDGEQIIFVDEPRDLVIVLTGDPGAKSWVLSPGINDLFTGIFRSIVGP
jgi:CubicO group peptidase (beta-lactamase class C family)